MVDVDAARAAVALALPAVELALRDPAAGDSGCLRIVVMDPLAPPDCTFEQAILHEHSINRDGWDADYTRFARAKAYVSWRTGMDSHRVQASMPQRLQPGDTLLWGSVCMDGIVVAVSGLHPWYDEAIAGMVACWLRAMAKGRAAAAARNGPFLPG